MARTLKNFNTEEEYEEWVNSPYMRTPYTCLVKETGNVHYFDGDDEDDLTVTIVAKHDGFLELCSASIAPKIDYENNIWDSSEIYRIVLNDEVIFDEYEDYVDRRLIGRGWKYYEDYGYIECQRNVGGASLYEHNHNENYYARKYIYANKDDVIKLYFRNDEIPRCAFYNCGYNVKEYIVGNGFKKIRCMAFKNDNTDFCDFTINIGYNIKRIVAQSFVGAKKVVFNLARKGKPIRKPEYWSDVCGNAKVIKKGLKFIYRGRNSSHAPTWWEK